MNKILLTLPLMVLSGSLPAQESPTTPKAAHVKITQGPQIELAREYLTIIRWTVNNPGGSPVHYGVVRFGSDPKDLRETASNPIRLNPSHSSTVFRVRLADLKPRTTYYYTVSSMEANGRNDGVTSAVSNFTTP
jgi:Purple acid Phosphatase, N-terminal domain